jgi:hypothetical protein
MGGSSDPGEADMVRGAGDAVEFLDESDEPPESFALVSVAD